MLKIDKNIPIPYRKAGALRTQIAKYLTEMQTGDSFPILAKRQGTARLAARECGIKIAIRRENDTEVRVWKK